MIELERHIEILLLNNDCVIVPNLGGFVAHHVNARYDASDGLFLPPLRTIGFNPQLTMNDSLLVQSYIEAYDISYPEALRRIEKEVAELRQILETEGQYELNDIGILRLKDDGRMEFTPCEAGILTPSLYGLNSFEMRPIRQMDSVAEAIPAAIASEEVVTDTEDKADMKVEAKDNTEAGGQEKKSNDTIVIKMSWLRNAAAIAAAILAFFIIQTPVSNSNMVSDVQQSAFVPVSHHHTAMVATAQETEEPVEDEEAEVKTATVSSAVTVKNETKTEKTMVEAAPAPVKKTTAEPKREAKPKQEMTAARKEMTPKKESSAKKETAPKQEPAIQESPVQKKETKGYTIVLASQVKMENARIFVKHLHEMGYKGARIANMKNSSKVRVIYGPFNTENEAYNELARIRKHDSLKESWVLRP